MFKLLSLKKISEKNSHLIFQEIKNASKWHQLSEVAKREARKILMRESFIEVNTEKST